MPTSKDSIYIICIIHLIKFYLYLGFLFHDQNLSIFTYINIIDTY